MGTKTKIKTTQNKTKHKSKHHALFTVFKSLPEKILKERCFTSLNKLMRGHKPSALRSNFTFHEIKENKKYMAKYQACKKFYHTKTSVYEIK